MRLILQNNDEIDSSNYSFVINYALSFISLNSLTHAEFLKKPLTQCAHKKQQLSDTIIGRKHSDKSDIFNYRGRPLSIGVYF